MRVLAALLMLVLLGTFAPLSLQPPAQVPDQAWVAFEPLPPPEGKRIGRLQWLGGWSLTSNDPRFGGLSALHVEDGRALAFSDAGWRIEFPLPGPSARAPAAIAGLADGPGSPKVKSNRDVEAIAVHGGHAWLSFERANAVWRYDRDGWRSAARAKPPAMKDWRGNAGGEAMVRLADGRFLIVSEGEGGETEALLFSGDPAVPGTSVRRLRYRPPEGFRPTDAALLPDGRVLFLHRRFRLLEGFTAVLTLSGEEVARFGRADQRDNFEGLAVAREGGRTILWIVSDDNYFGLQRTLLLKLAVE